jgi:hypothetical protein
MKRSKKCYDLMDLAFRECNKKHRSSSISSNPDIFNPVPPAFLIRPKFPVLNPSSLTAPLKMGDFEDFWGDFPVVENQDSNNDHQDSQHHQLAIVDQGFSLLSVHESSSTQSTAITTKLTSVANRLRRRNKLSSISTDTDSDDDRAASSLLIAVE